MRGSTLTRPFREREIAARVTRLDRGVHVLLTGGDVSHIGAVALGENGAVTHTFLRPGHREGELAERWAAALSARYGEAAVACGIHYENITREEIAGVLAVCEELLTALMSDPLGETRKKE